jgi:hypothetical protein
MGMQGNYMPCVPKTVYDAVEETQVLQRPMQAAVLE